MTHTQAVCGPVGDCNAVQSSDYAYLFGIPVALLGLGTYLALFVLSMFGLRRPSPFSARMLAAISGGGVVFSVYLTFLEPFVIGAVCL